jgi:hypothetical protein
LTIRNWFDRSRVTFKPRRGAHAGTATVTTPDPPQSDDSPVNSEAGAPNGGPEATAVPSILVAVRKTGEGDHCIADLTNDIPNAQGMVAAWVESGVPPDAVSVWRVNERPLNISYEWSVEIRDHVKRGPDRRSSQRPAQPAEPSSTSRARPLTGAPAGGKPIGVLSRANDLMHEIMPEEPFQLRPDRLIWLGLWAASLLILGMLLVASLSGGNTREFVIGGQASPSVDESVGSNVTARPTVAASPSPGVSAAAPACLQGAVNNCECQDFGSQGEAQKFFTSYPPPQRQPVDPDGDGLVCEWLPKISPSPRQ